MKKLLITLLLVIGLCGCETNLMNTPTKRVETMLNNYITLNSEVLDDLDNTISKDTTMNDKQKNDYKNVIKKLYQNMSYKIKNETIDGDNAIVTVEIEVYNLKKTIDEVNNYLENHKDEFIKDNELDKEAFNDYKIKELKNVNDKVTYTLDLSLSKIEDKWVLNDLSDTEISKIHGMYEY